MRSFVARGLLVTAALAGGAGVAAAAQLYRHAPAEPAAAPRIVAPSPPAPARAGAEPDPARLAHSFYFSRAAYTGGGWGRRRGGGGGSWATDYPKADRQFLVVLRRLTNLDAYPEENAVRLDDPNLRRFPFLYMLEVGAMSLTEEEVKGLRDYLLAGGFLMVDDFHGTYQWQNFEEQMRRVFPEFDIVEMPKDHPIFSSYYDISEVVQVPVVESGIRGGPTHEQDGVTPHVRAIFDARGRLMVAINWNTDLGDAWEWAEHPQYPLRYSTYAFQVGVNTIVYAMSH